MIDILTHSFLEKPKKVSFEGEDKDEDVVYVFRKALITNVGWLLFTMFLLVIPLIVNVLVAQAASNYPKAISASNVFIFNAFWYLGTFGFAFERFLHWFFNIYIVSDKRIVDVDYEYLLHKNVSEAPLRNIEDITYTIKGPLQTLFNYGTVYIQTAAEKGRLEFDDVSSPGKVQDIISDLVSQIRGKRGN